MTTEAQRHAQLELDSKHATTAIIVRPPRMPEISFDDLPEPSRWSWVQALVVALAAFALGACIVWVWLT